MRIRRIWRHLSVGVQNIAAKPPCGFAGRESPEEGRVFQPLRERKPDRDCGVFMQELRPFQKSN